MKTTLRKVIDLSQDQLKPDVELPSSMGTLAPVKEIPLSQVEAEFLIGVSFRLTLQSVIYTSQNRHDLGVLQTKRGSPAWQAAAASCARYAHSVFRIAARVRLAWF